ncbi:MAG: hypothetical protein ACK559_20655, partial [bacterium]
VPHRGARAAHQVFIPPHPDLAPRQRPATFPRESVDEHELLRDGRRPCRAQDELALPPRRRQPAVRPRQTPCPMSVSIQRTW